MSPSVVIIVVLMCLFVFFGLVVFFGAPYVPSHRKDVKRLFEYVQLGNSDILVDVGSGDGIILRIASSYGAKAVGYEINPILVGISRMLSFRDSRVSILLQNLWLAKLPHDTTIVYAFAVQRDEKKLMTLLQREATRLKKPLKLICYGSPFEGMVVVDTYEAYHVYIFQPLQPKNA